MQNASSLWLTVPIAFTLLVGSAGAAPAENPSPDARYRSDRAVCLSGQSNQDRATCLKEAGAARDEARRHHLNDAQASYQQNALARCSNLPAGDKVDCQRRIQGDGSVSGSVRDGGLTREVTTITSPPLPVPATPVPVEPAPVEPAQ